ncbi:MAG: hypothetical protein NVSMB17_01650 [Candidatus Dormibacteria bacterium]
MHSSEYAYAPTVHRAFEAGLGRSLRRIPAVKVAIVGSRHFPEMERVTEFVRSLPAGAIVVTGGASGVDATAGQAARERALGLIKLPPRFEETTDPAASGRRNQELVDSADVLVAFWDGRSNGTRRTVDRALESGKEVHVLLPGSPGLGARGEPQG